MTITAPAPAPRSDPLSSVPPPHPGTLADWIHETRQLCEDVEFGLPPRSTAARLHVLLADMQAVAYRKGDDPR